MPTRWAMDALDAVTWRGQGYAAALGGTALWRFNATEDRNGFAFKNINPTTETRMPG